MNELVSVGVPVYRGERFVEETLHSIASQTHRELDVLISIDGPDPACEAICERFLGDSRFRMVVRPQRSGWVGNLNWLRSQARGHYWYFHQQDDLVAESYVAKLLSHAREHPEAALVYCDVRGLGRIDTHFTPPPPVVGSSAFLRELAILHDHFPAFAFRGLTRVDALRRAGDIPTNDVSDFGVDLVALAAIALSGELHRVPETLYRKRYHDGNTESRWWDWSRAQRRVAWSRHCADVLEQALRVEGTAADLRLLFLAAIERLASPLTAGHFLPTAELTQDERREMYHAFLRHVRSSPAQDLPVLLDAEWDDIEHWSDGFRWVPRIAMVDIVGYGPDPLPRGGAFNIQPGGGSAIWVRTSHRAAPDSRLRLNGTLLETQIQGTLLTALVPPELIATSGELDLVVAAPDGTERSPRVQLGVSA